MATNILVETKPIASVETLLYVVGLDSSTTGTVFCMNQSAYDDKISVALVPFGSRIAPNSYIAYKATINSGHSVYLQQLALGFGDKILVTSSAGSTNFIFTGHSVP